MKLAKSLRLAFALGSFRLPHRPLTSLGRPLMTMS